MQIFLTVLLWIFVILISLILLILFFPITYEAKAGKETETITAKALVKWLFGLVRVIYEYPTPGCATVKIAFFTVYRADKKDTSKEETSKEEISGKTKKNTKKIKKEVSSTMKEEETVSEENEALTADANELPVREELPSKIQTDTKEEKEKISLTEKISNKINELREKIEAIKKKVLFILKHIEFYKNLLQETETKEYLMYVLKRVVKILKRIKPKRLEADVLFGADSPDITGYVYAVYGMILPYLGKNDKIRLTPNFENAVMDGRLYIKGSITVFCLLINALAVLIDKRFGRLRHKIKKFESLQTN